MKNLKYTGVLSLLLAAFFIPLKSDAQVYKWMNIGSLHNWFSEMGCEIEVGRTSSASQQDGLQWPAIHDFQDNQAQKGFWIGCTDFTDGSGSYDYRVVHVGPRGKGVGEFFPTRFEMVSRFDPTQVFVDGDLTFEKKVEVDFIDESLPAERLIINETNTLLGITMTRNVMQWSTPPHDNYMIYEYIFENTGNTDGDADIELPGQTLEGVYFFWQYRYSITRQTRYVIGNGTGWGMNTMHDARGDGFENPLTYADPVDENFRAQFAWHGYFPAKIVSYDNIGAPIFQQDDVSPHYVSEKDTVGRLGAPQFVGVVTLHADAAADDETDDPSQPSTTGHYGSDEPNTATGINAFDPAGMESEYGWMRRGHMERHAWKVEPSGDFAGQTNAPNIPPGKPGGFSIGDGYGPYTIGPGETIRIVIAEAAAGLDRQNCIDIGRQYKNGEINARTKNEAVMTGRDSLFKTFRLAQDNFQSGYSSLPAAPRPPKIFNVDGGGDGINLSWELFGEDPNLAGFRIYRQVGNYVDPILSPHLVYEAGADELSYVDTSPVRGVAYYYYLLAVGLDGSTSSRYFTQAYAPVFLSRPAGERASDIRIVPNPFVISADPFRLRFPGTGEGNKISFVNIPGRCTIQIFTEIGEIVRTIDHNAGTGDASWDALTSSRQLVVSGVYIAVITNKDTGERTIEKFVVIR